MLPTRHNPWGRIRINCCEQIWPAVRLMLEKQQVQTSLLSFSFTQLSLAFYFSSALGEIFCLVEKIIHFRGKMDDFRSKWINIEKNHHHIIIWICFWVFVKFNQFTTIVRQQCCQRSCLWGETIINKKKDFHSPNSSLHCNALSQSNLRAMLVEN